MHPKAQLMRRFRLTWMMAWMVAGLVSSAATAQALPPPEDTPEEVLRTAIITDARSPLDGRPLTAAEYARLQAELQDSQDSLLPSQIRYIIFLLQLRRVIKPVLPIVP